MQSCKLKISDTVVELTNSKYRVKSLDEQKQRLDASKSKLDADFTKDLFGKYWSECDFFSFRFEKGLFNCFSPIPQII